MHPNLILASASPRRRELLSRMGLAFEVCPACGDETLVPGLTAIEQVKRLSRLKAEAVSTQYESNDVILSADTIVVLNDRILGKPKDEADVARMLRELSGRSHFVLTGVTVCHGGRCITHCETTEVYFRPMAEKEISAYIATGECMDKAGAYGIQGYAAVFVEKLVGDYYNVMGLPVCRVALMLRDAGIPILEAQG